MANAGWQRFATVAMICVLVSICSAARASETTLDMGLGQYKHRAWTLGEGFVDAPVHAMAQSPDGYLWLGTQAGLWRFDGARVVPWGAPDGQHLPGKWIQSLQATKDGTLWIGTDGGLVNWHDGKLTEYPALAGLDVLALLVDKEGTVWAGTESHATSTGRLCAIRDKSVRCYGEDGSLGTRIYGLYEDADGNLWFTSSSGVWRWRPGKPKIYPMLDTMTGYFQNLTSGSHGGVLVSAHDGLQEIVKGEVRAFPIAADLSQVPPPFVLTDRDGALWIGTIGIGLRYVHAGRMESFAKADGLSGDQIMKMFEDREGDIWVATKTGLDEFWKVAAAKVPGDPNLSDGSVTSVLADVDGSVWFAMQTGLYRRKNGEMTVYRRHGRQSEMPGRKTALPSTREIIATGLPIDTSGSLYQDHRGRIWLGSPSGLGYLQNDRFVAIPGMPGGELTCITEDDSGNLWVAHSQLGLFRISPDREIKRYSWADLGIGETWSIVFDPSRKGLWLGSTLGEIAFFANGQIRASYGVKSHGQQAVRSLRLDPDGTLWAATESGLIRLRNGHLTTLNSENGLPCDIVHATVDNDPGSFWIYTACGIVRVARSDLDAWGGGTLNGRASRTLVLDTYDGVRSSDVWHFNPKIAKLPDGRLWFASSTGPMTVDPRNLFRNAFAPPMQIEQLVADHKTYDTSSLVRLPPLVRDLELGYTALSFVAPEKNQFRYKLEGEDSNWIDAGNRRQAFYTGLAPGNYRFRVIASNNDGVWNEQGATLALSVAPAYWQTSWFLVLCAITLSVFIFAMYQTRRRQQARTAALAEERRTELAHANRVSTMGHLTASIAHEVSQPLTASATNALAALRWLAATPPNVEEIKQALERIVQDSNRARDVVMRIRKLVKKAPIEEGNVNINDEILGVLEITRSEALKQGIVVHTELSPDLPNVKGDRIQLQQLLLNIVVNAIEAMSTLNDSRRVLMVRAEPDAAGGIAVSLSDTGPGLPSSGPDQIFEPFHTSKKDGLGMGLSICRSVVEAHGGKLTVTRNAPRGAIFVIILPANRTVTHG